MGRRQKSTDDSRSASIRQRAYLYIRRKIAEGELQAGNPVSELELASDLGSSRTPVREAIGQLIAEGLLEQNQAGGVFVVQFTREDILDLYELREALETFALCKVARLGLMQPTDREHLQILVDAIRVLRDELQNSGASTLDADQMSRCLAADVSFHALLMGLSKNARIHKEVNETRLLMRIFSMRRQGHDSADLERIYKQHTALIEAVACKDSEETARIISAHLHASQQERLEEFDQYKREASIKNTLSAFQEMYQPFMS